MCPFSQNKNRNRVRNGRIESAPGATAALEMATQGRLGAAKGQNGRLSLPRRRSGTRNGCSRLPRGRQGAQNCRAGLSGSRMGRSKWLLLSASESQKRSKWWLTPASETQGRSALESTAQRCCLYSLVLCITFHYAFPCVTVLVEVWHVTSK